MHKISLASMIRTTTEIMIGVNKFTFLLIQGCILQVTDAKRDKDGFRITGRVDDVINVSGHRMGTAEVENGINEHNSVVESAVVGYPHDIKGQGIYACYFGMLLVTMR